MIDFVLNLLVLGVVIPRLLNGQIGKQNYIF